MRLHYKMIKMPWSKTRLDEVTLRVSSPPPEGRSLRRVIASAVEVAYQEDLGLGPRHPCKMPGSSIPVQMSGTQKLWRDGEGQISGAH